MVKFRTNLAYLNKPNVQNFNHFFRIAAKAEDESFS